MGDVTHVASETIQGYRVVRSFGGEVYEQQRFLAASQGNTDKQLRMTRTGAIYTPLLQLVIYSAMAILMFLVLYLRGDASAGEMVAYITMAGLLPKPIRQLSEVSSTIQRGWPVPKVFSSSWMSSRKSIAAPWRTPMSVAAWKYAI